LNMQYIRGGTVSQAKLVPTCDEFHTSDSLNVGRVAAGRFIRAGWPEPARVGEGVPVA